MQSEAFMRRPLGYFSPFTFALFLTLFCNVIIFGMPAAASDSGRTLKAYSLLSPAALAPAESAKVRVIIVIEAPDIAPAKERPPISVALVIDRSGSMSETRKLEYAKEAARVLVDNLKPDDNLSLVAYADGVSVIAPLAPVTDKKRLSALIDNLKPGGSTFLSGGLSEGIEQLKSVRREGPCRVILLSDGLANKGVTDAELVAAIGAKADGTGISVSSLGLGLDFNEDMMQLLAQRGGGRYYYIKDSEFLPSVVREELADLADAFTDRLRVTVTWAPGVSGVKVIGYETSKKDNGLEIGMSDIAAGEKRQIALEFAVSPEIAAGRRELGVLRLAYKNRDTGVDQSVSLPIMVDVSADAAERWKIEKVKAATVAGVNEEFLLREAEAAHVKALEELRQGKVEEARKLLRSQQSALAAAPASKAVGNKLDKMRQVEAQLDAAVQDQDLQKNMTKSGKASFLRTASGSKQGIMLRSGDKGYLVERLQTTLKQAGVYKGAVDGVYGPDVVEAVKEFQKTKGLAVDGIAGTTTLQTLGIN
jgi:Ca-activated chloride channel family protein